MSPDRPMHEIYKDMRNDAIAGEYTHDTLAEELESSPSTLHKWCEPHGENGSGRDMPHLKYMRLTKASMNDSGLREDIRRAQSWGLLKDLHFVEELNFEGATLTGDDLSGRDLTCANFRGAKIIDVDFTGCKLMYANFSGAYILGVTKFDRANLTGANLNARHIDGASFRKANIRVSMWGDAYVANVDFQDCNHTGTDFRKVRWGENIRWFADHYRGGLLLSGSTGLENFIGVSQSHGFNRWQILQHADGRPKWKMLAGWTEVDILGEWSDVGCWLQLMHIIETEFSSSEQKEIYEVLTAEPRWGNHIRIAFEKEKREWVSDLYIDGMPPGRQEVNLVIKGRECEFFGRKGKISRGGLFVPEGTDGFEDLLTATGVDNVIDEIVQSTAEEAK